MELNLIDYEISKRFALTDVPFAALIAGALQKADTENFQKLEAAFPNIADDLKKRYNAPSGFIGNEFETIDVNRLNSIIDNYYPLIDK